MEEYNINTLLSKAVELKASDIHYITGEVPAMRVNGKILKTNLSAVTQEDIIQAIKTTAPQEIQKQILDSSDFDYPYELKGVARFRINLARTFGKYSLNIRVISFNIPTLKELNLPESLEKFTSLDNGIILVTGSSGSGKSTTIASIIEFINNNYQKHIITIEDPIEYVYTSKKSIFTQRQIGLDTKNYEEGIKYTLRQDPDIIVIGEIRDRDTVKSALFAAETGHLVIATMHTYNAVHTINRLLSFFEPIEREIVRSQFTEVFRGTISQKLLLKADSKGRIPAVEILFSTPTIKDFIIKNELEEIYKLVQKGSYNDMITFNESLYELYKNNLITQETAINNSDNPNELMHLIKGVFYGSEGF